LAAPLRYYFDWAASAIPDPQSGAEPECPAQPATGRGTRFGTELPFGNPSSLHREGRAARRILEEARERAADIFNVRKEQLYWTSGASESNAIVLFSFFRRCLRTGALILTNRGEHPSILENCKVIESLGVGVRYADLNPEGRVPEEKIKTELERHKDISLVLLMAVNNETGAVTNLESAVRLIRSVSKRSVHIHSDMVQALGKIPVSLDGVDSASFSGHKIGAARGTGLLYLKKPLDVLISGGGQERGVRSGTENLAGICSFVSSLESHCSKERQGKDYAAAEERMCFLIKALEEIPACSIIPACRTPVDSRFSPYILQCSFKGLPGEAAVRILDDSGFAVSTGSACSSNRRAGKPAKHYVLAAMGIDAETASNSIRISQGCGTAMEEIKKLAATLKTLPAA